MTEGASRVVCPACDAVNRVPRDRPAAAAKCGRCHEALFQGRPLALDGERLRKHLAASDLPVIVDFWASWCGPCRAMGPVFDRAAAELEPRARFIKVDVDKAPEAAQAHGVRGVPALFAFVGGKPAAQQAGVTELSTLRNWVERLA